MMEIWDYVKARYLSKIEDEKAQGIVEYALILAFVVVLALALTNAGGLKEKVMAVFTSVGNALSAS